MVRKGARGIPLVLFKPLDERGSEGGDDHAHTDDRGNDTRRRVLVRHLHVFHVSDCNGLPEAEHDSVADGSLAARIVSASGAKIVPGAPAYRVHDDVVQLPDVAYFATVDDYYATAFHELVHWTAPRVQRELAMKRFGDDAYCAEELVAELGAAMLCGAAGVPMISRCAAYLDPWLKVLRADKTAIFTTAAQAQRAADHLVGLVAEPSA